MRLILLSSAVLLMGSVLLVCGTLLAWKPNLFLKFHDTFVDRDRWSKNAEWRKNVFNREYRLLGIGFCACGLFFVFITLTKLLSSPAQGVATLQEPIVVHDFADLGVSLMSSTDPQFDARMTDLIPSWSATAAALKPHLVVLSNDSKRTIVAYCMLFETTRRDGRVVQNLVQFKYPNAVAGTGLNESGLPRGREVRSGEKRVVGTNFEIMPDAHNEWLIDFARQQSGMFNDMRKLEVRIDAVIFDDGWLIGEETCELQQNFEKYLHALQTIFRDVVSRLDGGSSIEETFQWLRSASAAAREKEWRDSSDQDAFYFFEAAGDVLRARRRVGGDSRVRDVFANAIRQTQFVITRQRD